MPVKALLAAAAFLAVVIGLLLPGPSRPHGERKVSQIATLDLNRR